jgi:hypothetical protein
VDAVAAAVAAGAEVVVPVGVADAALAAVDAALAAQAAACHGDLAACAKPDCFPDTLTYAGSCWPGPTKIDPANACSVEADKGIAVVGEYALRRRAGTIGRVRLLAS